MTIIWLIVNSASGSFDAAMPDALRAAAAAQGGDLARVIMLPDESLPSTAELVAGRVDILAIHTGDGTINSATQALRDWTQGAILALPGGTMNLLARHLHGEGSTSPQIIGRALSPNAIHRAVTTVIDDDDPAIWGLVGLFAGPTTAWGDVREELRHGDIGALVASVPRAISATFSGDPVSIAGDDRSFPAIYAEPVHGQLRLMGFTAEGAGDLFNHGFAWLGGDFRNGPHEMRGLVDQVTILCDAAEVGLLIDGERATTAAPLNLRASHTGVKFIATALDPR